jgi:hypothetical protein
MSSWTEEELAKLAEDVRKAAGFLTWQRMDVPKLIGKFECASDPKVRIEFREASSSFMRGVLAQAEPAIRKVHYIAGLMGKLLAGDKVAAAVFLEEIAHILLGHRQKVLNHSVGRNLKVEADFTVELMEDEAQKFTWFIQAPISEVYSIKDPKYLEKSFGFTEEAAIKYCALLKKTRDSFDAPPNPSPTNVLKFTKNTVSPDKRAAAGNQNTAEISLKSSMPPIKNQYSGFSSIPCKNCGQMSVKIQSGCDFCTICGDEDGCS